MLVSAVVMLVDFFLGYNGVSLSLSVFFAIAAVLFFVFTIIHVLTTGRKPPR